MRVLIVKGLLFIGCLVLSTYIHADCDNNFSIATAPVAPLVTVKEDRLEGNIGLVATDSLTGKGIKYKPVVVNWPRALIMAGTGEVDAIFPTLYSEERAKYLDYSLSSIGQIHTSLYRHRNEPMTPLSSASVATLRSLEYDKNELQGATVFEVSDFEQLVSMLNRKRVDYIYGVKEIIDSEIALAKFEDIVELKVIAAKEVYIALSKKSQNYPFLTFCLGL